MTKKSTFKSGFTLGGEQAEADPLLTEAFFESGDYDVIRSRRDPRCFIIGRTGAGKSAAFQRIEEEADGHVIRINPEDLSLPYITDLQVIRYLDSLGVNLDLFWIALWKHVLLVEIIRHRYRVNTPAAKQSFLKNLRDRISKDHGKEAALGYLDEFEGRFWCETEERVREITDKFTRRIDAEVAGGIELAPFSGSGSVGVGTENSTETRAEQAEKFQRIVNDTQLAKLNKMIAVLDEDILDDQHFTYVIVDDLDRDWVDEHLANDLIRCLFRTVLDLKRVRNLKVVVALRTNIFQELDFGKKSGGQEEKFRSLVLNMRWTPADLEDLLDERVHAAAMRVNLEASALRDLLPQANRTRGNPVHYILDRTLMRPRDAIAFANECLSVGVGKTRLTWQDIQKAERTYSAKRLLALRDEWKPTYPGIDKVIEKFRGSPARMDRLEFQDRLDEIMLLISDPNFDGTSWLTDFSSKMWTPDKDATWFSIYQPLTRLLFGIGLIGGSPRSSRAPTFFLDDPLFMDSELNLENSQHFFTHRTYHAALDVRLAGLEAGLAFQ